MPRLSSGTIEFLFRPPTVEPTTGWNSTLHLLRREIQETLANIRRTVNEDTFLHNRPLHRLFASAILICSGFDLLAKLKYGDEKGGESFQRLLVRHGRLGKVHAKRVWDLRNSLMHSFGLRIIHPRNKKIRGKPIRQRASTVSIILNADLGMILWAVQRHDSRTWVVNVPALYVTFVDVVQSFHRDVYRPMPRERLRRLHQMVRRYGRIRIA